jgi:hypothetical protein
MADLSWGERVYAVLRAARAPMTRPEIVQQLRLQTGLPDALLIVGVRTAVKTLRERRLAVCEGRTWTVPHQVREPTFGPALPKKGFVPRPKFVRPEKKIGISEEDANWMAYWRMPRAERRKQAAPTTGAESSRADRMEGFGY